MIVYTNLRSEIKKALYDLELEKPFVGVPEKDYYRGQWDALMWVLEDLLETGTNGKL